MNVFQARELLESQGILTNDTVIGKDDQRYTYLGLHLDEHRDAVVVLRPRPIMGLEPLIQLRHPSWVSPV